MALTNITVSDVVLTACHTIDCQVILGGVMVIVLAIGPKVREFKPGRERWMFKGDKNP
jgi:hypothetical protein